MVGLTDLLLVTLNPQLATGERPELLSVLAQEWPEDGIWFLISRADEGGVDPEFDPTASPLGRSSSARNCRSLSI
jgi:hypothetical protein